MMDKIAKYYVLAFYGGFLALLLVLYRTNEVIDLYPGKVAAGFYALIGILTLLAILARVVSKGNRSRIVTNNPLVGNWRRKRLAARQCRNNALLNIVVLYAVFALMVAFSPLFANYFFITVVLGYLTVEILKTRFHEINIWRLHFSPVALGLILTFVALLLTGMWAK